MDTGHLQGLNQKLTAHRTDCGLGSPPQGQTRTGVQPNASDSSLALQVPGRGGRAPRLPGLTCSVRLPLRTWLWLARQGLGRLCGDSTPCVSSESCPMGKGAHQPGHGP